MRMEFGAPWHSTGLRLVAGVLSLFAGIFLAFFLEYWQRISRERGEGARPAVA